jgi:hypothetical protein
MTKKYRLFTVFSVLFLSTLACARTVAPASTKPTGLPAGETTHVLTHDGLERSYNPVRTRLCQQKPACCACIRLSRRDGQCGERYPHERV